MLIYFALTTFSRITNFKDRPDPNSSMHLPSAKHNLSISEHLTDCSGRDLGVLTPVSGFW